MNSPFVHEQSEAFARQLLAAPGDDASRVRLGFETAHGRVASEAEVSEALSFVTEYQTKLGQQNVSPDRQPVAAWSALARVLLTGNAFLYVD